MTSPTPANTGLREQLEAALAATGSPLSLAPRRPTWLPDDEIDLDDSRFVGGRTMILASRLEGLLSTQSITEVTTALENLSAAHGIADAVESLPSTSYPGAHATRDGFTDKALTYAVVSLYSVDDHMTVDVPVRAVDLYNEDRIGISAMHALEAEVNRVTGTTFLERGELARPVGELLRDGPLDTSPRSVFSAEPFEPSDPFTATPAEHTLADLDVFTSTKPEVEPGYAPDL